VISEQSAAKAKKQKTGDRRQKKNAVSRKGKKTADKNTKKNRKTKQSRKHERGRFKTITLFFSGFQISCFSGEF
jgi:hypothetical protein